MVEGPDKTAQSQPQKGIHCIFLAGELVPNFWPLRYCSVLLAVLHNKLVNTNFRNTQDLSTRTNYWYKWNYEQETQITTKSGTVNHASFLSKLFSSISNSLVECLVLAIGMSNGCW